MRSIFPILLIIAGLGLFFGYTKPLYSGAVGFDSKFLTFGGNIKDLRAEKDEYERAIGKVRQIRERLLALEAAKTSYTEEDFKKLGRVVFSESFNRTTNTEPFYFDPVRFVIDLNNISARRGFQLKNLLIKDGASGTVESALSSKTKNKSASLEQKEFSFSVDTTYPRLAELIADIESSLRIIDIKNVSFSSTDNGIFNVSMSVGTYELKTDK